jgi:hypothetical protein
MGVFLVLLLASWVITATISANLEFSPNVADPVANFDWLHDKLWFRLGPVCGGVVAGVILHRFKEGRTVKWGQVWNVVN